MNADAFYPKAKAMWGKGGEEAYGKGGAYHFSPKPRSGEIDWIKLRDLAKALLLFENGRTLHERYVHLVVTTRIPELFDKTEIKTVGDEKAEEDGDNEEEFDMDCSTSSASRSRPQQLPRCAPSSRSGNAAAACR